MVARLRKLGCQSHSIRFVIEFAETVAARCGVR